MSINKDRKPPAFQLYAADFLIGCAMMTAEETGGYIRLLCYQWEHGSVPDDDAKLAALTGCSGDGLASIRQKFGLKVAGGIANARLEKVRAEQVEYRSRQAENARKGWESRRKARLGNAEPDGLASPSHMPEPMPKRCSSSSYIGSHSRAREEESTPNPQITPPTLEQVKSAGSLAGAGPDCAAAFFHEMEACGWIDSRQRPIRNWRAALSKYSISWRSNVHQRNAKGGKPAAAPHQSRPLPTAEEAALRWREENSQ